MDITVELGREAVRIKRAAGDMNLGARPAAPPTPTALPAPAKPPAAQAPRTASLSLTMPQQQPAPAPAPASPAGGGMLGHVQSYLQKPQNMAQLIGASGDLGKGLLGATGAPGLFAISNLARGGGEMGSILRGGIPTGGAAGGGTPAGTAPGQPPM